MLRRLHPEQPDSFAFTPANLAWAEAQITKYPEGRQASAVIPLLWRAQEQEGWLSRPAMERVAAMLDMAYIRVLEVATFYFMFQLTPTGSIAHVQVCGTTSCMICGAEDLMAVCREKIAAKAHVLSGDGKFTWEEVECLGACANAPMAQIGKDYYEDLTAERFAEILDEMAEGRVPVPGPQNGRFAAEPKAGLTSLRVAESERAQYNASVQLAVDIGDTLKRIDGTEAPLVTPWLSDPAEQEDPERPSDGEARLRGDASDGVSEVEGQGGGDQSIGKPEHTAGPSADADVEPTPSDVTPRGVQGDVAPRGDTPAEPDDPVDETGAVPPEAAPSGRTIGYDATPDGEGAEDTGPGARPSGLTEAREGGADDLKRIRGVGPKLEALLNRLGFWHFDQIAAWTGEEITWVDRNLEGFKGRVTRDDWVSQARILADGGETEFSKRADRGEV